MSRESTSSHPRTGISVHERFELIVRALDRERLNPRRRGAHTRANCPAPFCDGRRTFNAWLLGLDGGIGMKCFKCERHSNDFLDALDLPHWIIYPPPPPRARGLATPRPKRLGSHGVTLEDSGGSSPETKRSKSQQDFETAAGGGVLTTDPASLTVDHARESHVEQRVREYLKAHRLELEAASAVARLKFQEYREHPPLALRVLELLHAEHVGRHETFPCARSWLIGQLELRYGLRASDRQVRKALDWLLGQDGLVLVEDHREKRKGSPGRRWVYYRFGEMGSALRPPPVTRAARARHNRERRSTSEYRVEP